MALFTDGKTSGVCVDPIEKKPLNHFLPATRVLSFGTIGCNLSCKFCQNWHISHSKECGKLDTEVTPELIAHTAHEHKCESIAFTYNDPVIFMEFAQEVAKHAQPLGIKTVAVTAGYMCTDPAKEFFQYIDAANVDLKAFSRRFYSQICNAKIEPVLETLKLIKEAGKWLEITNLVIPGKNDDMREVTAMCEWIFENLGGDVPVHFTAFHPDGEMLDAPRTPRSTLLQARNIARACGLQYVYCGNINDESSQSTYCSGCSEPLILRDWHTTSITPSLIIHPHEGTATCSSCGTACPGTFQPPRYHNATISRPYRINLD